MTAVPKALRNRSREAVFLCYHAIAEEGPAFLTVSPELFERQLDVLQRGGWSTGGRAELAALAEGRRLSRPTAFLTFDDGFVDNHTAALPLLKRYGAKAIVFLLPGAVDAGGELRWPEVSADADRYPDVMRSLDWDQVGEMVETGIDFGAHTMTHPSLPTLDDARLLEELAESRVRVADKLGSCDSLAYPFGHWDARVRAAAAHVGYRFAFTLPAGHQPTATPLSIPRLSIDHRDDERRFGLKLSPLGRRILLSPAKQAMRRVRDRAQRSRPTKAAA